MKITKRQLRRIIKEEISRMRLISEEAQPSLEDLDALIKKKEQNLQTLMGYRGMDPSIEDAIADEEAAIGKLQGLHKKMRAERDRG